MSAFTIHTATPPIDASLRTNQARAPLIAVRYLNAFPRGDSHANSSVVSSKPTHPPKYARLQPK
jgi:hypothetical protein